MEPASGGDTVVLTCQTCDLTTTQAAGSRRRTVCPHCGNFYHSPQQTVSVQMVGNGLSRRGPNSSPRQTTTSEHLPQLDRQNERGGHSHHAGFGKSIANFFKNMGKESKDDSRVSSAQLSRSHSSSSAVPGPSHSRQQSVTQLPPIDTSSNQLMNSSLKSPSQFHLLSPNGFHTSSSSEGLYSMVVPKDELDNEKEAENRRQDLLSRNLEELKSDVAKAKQSGDWNVVMDYFTILFESFLNLNAAFKIEKSRDYKTVDESGVNYTHVYGVYGLLATLPQEVHKSVLKAIINCLMKDKSILNAARSSFLSISEPRNANQQRNWVYSKDDLRAYLILLVNPQFRSIPTYIIFAHLLRQISGMSDPNHHFLVHWFKRIEATRFRELISKLQKFISCRLFPEKPEELPPVSKCVWWIPSATKVLALLNAANNMCDPPLVPYLEFYNSSLDYLDLLLEYYNWQSPPPNAQGTPFSFCQYPFILSILAKRTILQRDSEQQMVLMARQSLVTKVQQRQMPDIGMLFLNLRVRRSHLVSDSLNEIANRQTDLKKKLKVSFVGEAGLDMGGLTKEWFLLLIRQIFQPEYGMFIYDKTSRVYWFSTVPCENYQEFNLVGVLMGLAVYNSITLDVRFPPVCYRKLLNPAVVPYNMPQATVGIAKVTVLDLELVMPDLAHGLKELLAYEGDVEEDFGLTFQITHTEFGSPVTRPLKAGGENIPVTKENRQEYVSLYVDYLLNSSVYRQFQAFYHGFHRVCASNALIMLRPEEVELLVCGNPSLEMRELQRVTVYDGYNAENETVRNFWSVVIEMPEVLQKQVLLFATGSDRVPVGGMSEMIFKITRVDNTNMLPMAHTCFNQLVLPAYRSRKTLKQKLLIALQNAEGFGLE